MTEVGMKSLWELRVFCAVVERKSFVAAARQLGTSPSSVTRAVQALEEALGGSLLARSQKQVNLTLAGESYYVSARKMLDLQEEAEDELAALSEAPRGLLRFSAPEAMSHALLPPVLARMADANPELRFDVLYSDTILDPIREKLDFSIRGAFPASSELIGYPLWDYQRHLYASPDYVARHGSPQTPEQLPEHRVVIHSAPRVLKAWNFISAGHQLSLNLTPWHRVSSGSAVLNAVLTGLGVARLGDWLAEPLVRSGQLLRLCPDYRIVSSHGDNPQMHAVFANRRIPRKARLLLEAVRAAARDAGHGLKAR
ncbi:LysR family transcriptional regulator [Chromobacterium haemolyticum]|uniref:LysR family transcriptional regulator n=2 Tax=Chromobacterium haemolyticum TaxID=394935 RepID=A0A1W0D428_9NEIS|nr:LysR family transcriptional regulator [Chromobacterium haemolyticum]